MVTQKERRDSTRAGVITAARDLFTAVGTAAVPLDEIARRAGVAKSTVLYHFGSRSGVLRAVATELFNEAVPALRPSEDPSAWCGNLLVSQLTPEARVLHEIGDELSQRGELVGVDPVPFLEVVFAEQVRHPSPHVAAFSVFAFGRGLAYGSVDPDRIDDFVVEVFAVAAG